MELRDVKLVVGRGVPRRAGEPGRPTHRVGEISAGAQKQKSACMHDRHLLAWGQETVPGR